MFDCVKKTILSMSYNSACHDGRSHGIPGETTGATIFFHLLLSQLA